MSKLKYIEYKQMGLYQTKMFCITKESKNKEETAYWVGENIHKQCMW